MGEIWYSEKREADEPQYTVFRERPRLQLRPAADLIWLLLYHFPHQQIPLGQKHEYFSSDKKQKIIPPPQSVIVNLLIFISFRFLSFNDVGDHLLKKIMFAPPYGDVQVVSLQFDVKWVLKIFGLLLMKVFPTNWTMTTTVQCVQSSEHYLMNINYNLTVTNHNTFYNCPSFVIWNLECFI